MGKTNVSMHFRYSGNLPDCPGRRTPQNIYNTKNATFLATTFSEEHVKEEYLLTALLNFPVEEEVSISRQNTEHTTSTMSANQAKFSKEKKKRRRVPQQRS